MKRKQLKEIRTKSVKELKEMIVKSQAELVRLQSDLKTGKLKNVCEQKEKKRELAVEKTILREKELLDQNKATIASS